MAVVQSPVDLSDVLTELEAIISNIRLKNTTMINYYIFPDPVPNQIAAFAPRLAALDERRWDIASLSVSKLIQLLDDAPTQIATYLIPIAQQLTASVSHFQLLFIEYYDRSLAERKPYLQLWQRTQLLEHQLKHFISFHQQNPNRRSAVALQPPPSITVPAFCTAAVAFMNNQDRGRIQNCLPTELTSDYRALLRAQGGVCLWWECTMCAFRLRFHISNSAAMNINSTTEIRKHEELEGLEYRSSWLTKCHLFHPGRDEQVIERERRRTASMNPTSTISPKSRNRISISLNTSGVGGNKFGCPFCIASGKSLVAKETAFGTAKDFAKHISEKHTKSLPAPLLLQRFKVAVNGKTAPEVNQWDLSLS